MLTRNTCILFIQFVLAIPAWSGPDTPLYQKIVDRVEHALSSRDTFEPVSLPEIDKWLPDNFRANHLSHLLNASPAGDNYAMQSLFKIGASSSLVEWLSFSISLFYRDKKNTPFSSDIIFAKTIRSAIAAGFGHYGQALFMAAWVPPVISFSPVTNLPSFKIMKHYAIEPGHPLTLIFPDTEEPLTISNQHLISVLSIKTLKLGKTRNFYPGNPMYVDMIATKGTLGMATQRYINRVNEVNQESDQLLYLGRLELRQNYIESIKHGTYFFDFHLSWRKK